MPQEQLAGQRILAVTTNELVAYEAHYHLSCYKKYTKQYPKEKPVMAYREDEDTTAEMKAYTNFFALI